MLTQNTANRPMTTTERKPTMPERNFVQSAPTRQAAYELANQNRIGFFAVSFPGENGTRHEVQLHGQMTWDSTAGEYNIVTTGGEERLYDAQGTCHELRRLTPEEVDAVLNPPAPVVAPAAAPIQKIRSAQYAALAAAVADGSAALLQFGKEQQKKRVDNADREYQDYMLTFIGTNPNDIASYAVCSPAGNVYQPRAGRTYLIGRVGKNGYHASPDQTELCPDDYRTHPLNERLIAMGEAAFVKGKHSRIRLLLWLELPEVM